MGGLRLAAVDVGHDLRGIIPISIPLGPEELFAVQGVGYDSLDRHRCLARGTRAEIMAELRRNGYAVQDED